MFQQVRRKSTIGAVITLTELIYHTIVRNIRKGHRNAFWALSSNILTAIIFVAGFYFMFLLLGMGAKLRGDFMLYMLSGIFLFLTHTKTMAAVAKAEGPSSPMMQHAPMNTVISIFAAAIGTLYIQVLSLLVILFVYHVAVTPFEIDQPIGAFGMLLIGWISGAAIGLLLLSIRPWFPEFVEIFTTVYQRVNMVASGKLFVANTMPSFMLVMFDWNPLFHAIDQARGFIFLNYYPRNTSIEYPIIITVVLIAVGLMGEFYTRQHASTSWDAGR